MTARAVCPACARRLGGHVTAECPVCRGAGAVNLGPEALQRETPPIVARAVELYLEAATWATLDWHTATDHARDQSIALAVDALHGAGLLGPPITDNPPSIAGAASHEPCAVLTEHDELRARDLARQLTGPGIIPAAIPLDDELARRRARR